MLRRSADAPPNFGDLSSDGLEPLVLRRLRASGSGRSLRSGIERDRVPDAPFLKSQFGHWARYANRSSP